MTKHVLFAASEAAPFAKSGGLGDVIGALPHAIQNGWHAEVILPKYAHIPKSDLEFVEDFEVKLGWRRQYAGIHRVEDRGVTYWFVDNEYYFHRDQLYGYYDEAERYLFFSAAVVEWVKRNPDRYQAIHCHDWQTAWAVKLMKEKNLPVPVIYTIHNLRYQGRYGLDVAQDLMGYEKIPDELEYDGDLNLMKGAVVLADYVTTVSPTYAKEVMTREYGEGLDEILRSVSDHFSGVLNGLDLDKFNPMTDPALKVRYRYSVKKKKENKKALQEELNLEVREMPMLGFVSRLVEQKGLDLIVSVIHEMMNLDIQLVILGTGDKRYEELLMRSSREYPNRFRMIANFDEALAQRIYAASDMILMPSKFEPCGLTQMIAMRYAALPIVRATGGLRDTVYDLTDSERQANGFVFEQFNAYAMIGAIKRAVKTYQDPLRWQALMRQACQSARSWSDAAREYENIYDRMREGYE